MYLEHWRGRSAGPPVRSGGGPRDRQAPGPAPTSLPAGRGAHACPRPFASADLRSRPLVHVRSACSHEIQGPHHTYRHTDRYVRILIMQIDTSRDRHIRPAQIEILGWALRFTLFEGVALERSVIIRRDAGSYLGVREQLGGEGMVWYGMVWYGINPGEIDLFFGPAELLRLQATSRRLC